MTEEQFKDYFSRVLKKCIPDEARSAIEAYWKRFGMKPRLILGDRQIKECFPKPIEIAAVTGDPCLSIFAFREFLWKNAPETILQTVVQHELIHCYFDQDKSVESAIIAPYLHPPRVDLRSVLEKCIDGSAAEARRVRVYNAEESSVTRINKAWGGDEDAVRKWIRVFSESATGNSST